LDIWYGTAQKSTDKLTRKVVGNPAPDRVKTDRRQKLPINRDLAKANSKGEVGEIGSADESEEQHSPDKIIISLFV
jgi:hypothetical protein